MAEKCCHIHSHSIQRGFIQKKLDPKPSAQTLLLTAPSCVFHNNPKEQAGWDYSPFTGEGSETQKCWWAPKAGPKVGKCRSHHAACRPWIWLRVLAKGEESEHTGSDFSSASDLRVISNHEQVLTLWAWSSMNKTRKKGDFCSLSHRTELDKTPLCYNYSTQFSKQWMGGFLSSAFLANISAATPLVPNSNFHCLGHSPTVPKEPLHCLSLCKTSRFIHPKVISSPNGQLLSYLRRLSELIFTQLLIIYYSGFVFSTLLQAPHPETPPRLLHILYHCHTTTTTTPSSLELNQNKYSHGNIFWVSARSCTIKWTDRVFKKK